MEKASGGWRSIVNLLLLKFVVLSKFRMKTIALFLASIRKGDLMFPIDVKGTSFRVPVRFQSGPYRLFALTILFCGYNTEPDCSGPLFPGIHDSLS